MRLPLRVVIRSSYRELLLDHRGNWRILLDEPGHERWLGLVVLDADDRVIIKQNHHPGLIQDLRKIVDAVNAHGLAEVAGKLNLGEPAAEQLHRIKERLMAFPTNGLESIADKMIRVHDELASENRRLIKALQRERSR